jgi:hypothetical protein
MKILKNIYDEWHYPIMIKCGFIPLAEAFQSNNNKQYVYKHSINQNYKIYFNCGIYDVWYDNKLQKIGYKNDLLNHLINEINP